MLSPTTREDEARRARRAALLIAGALLLAVAVRLTIGLDPVVFFGLAAGLVTCLVIVGLDRLHAIERRMARGELPTRPRAPRDDTP